MFTHTEKCDMLECYLVYRRKSSLRMLLRIMNRMNDFLFRLYQKFRGNDKLCLPKQEQNRISQ